MDSFPLIFGWGGRLEEGIEAERSVTKLSQELEIESELFKRRLKKGK